MQNAVAFANNDVVTVAWSYGHRPDGCMGFAVYRVNAAGVETPLPSHAVFPGQKIKPGQTTEHYPIQKFYWKDPYARLEAEKSGQRTFRYKIVPLEGQPGHLTPMAGLPQVISNEVTISAVVSSGVQAVFNRGLISTQRVARALKGQPPGKAKNDLLAQVSVADNPLRDSLSGDMVEALVGFADRAKSSGRIYAALYELDDDQLVGKLVGLGKRLHVVLSDGASQTARDDLTGSGCQLVQRNMPPNHIAHNKFLVYVDTHGRPRAVLLGSTNWTSTGLCTQTNNTLVVDDSHLARRYLDYWKQLVADTKAAGTVAKDLQGTALRTGDATAKSFAFSGGTGVQSWFSPNTPAARTRAKGEKRPPDMEAVVQRIDAAEHAILFLAFKPGRPAVTTWAAQALRRNQELFVRGCLTDVSAAEGFYYELKGSQPPKKSPKDHSPPNEDPRVLGAVALGANVPEGWQRELLNAGFAIIHDKVLVIDPFSEKCVVVTGSHNLGYKASFDNDENLVIVEGNKALAVAYATHILDVYDHFAWRYNVAYPGPAGADQFLATKPDKWLSWYYDANGKVTAAQLRFWLQATV